MGGLQFAGVLGEALPLGVRIACVAGGVLLVAFGAFLIALPWKLASRKHDFIVQQTDNGELRIAVKAIENLVQKCIDLIKIMNQCSFGGYKPRRRNKNDR